MNVFLMSYSVTHHIASHLSESQAIKLRICRAYLLYNALVYLTLFTNIYFSVHYG